MLKSINPNLYDSCVDACQSDPRPTSYEQYLCQTVTPEVLFNRYGLVLCDFAPQQTLEGQLFSEQQGIVQEKQQSEQLLIYSLGTLLLILLAFLILT